MIGGVIVLVIENSIVNTLIKSKAELEQSVDPYSIVMMGDSSGISQNSSNEVST